MAEGPLVEDDQDQPVIQKSRKTQVLNQQSYSWSEFELKELVREGTLTVKEDGIEHVALHPFWLSNPLTGVAEELQNYLGKWRSSMNGYLVAFKHVRLLKNETDTSSRARSQMGFMYQDQPWVHVDASANFYLYTPTVGQKLRGTIRKFGAKAVVCVLFNCFSATVAPRTKEEFMNWHLGEELPFEIVSFQNRRRGPIIQARSIESNLDIDQTFEDWTIGEEIADKSSNQDNNFEEEGNTIPSQSWNEYPELLGEESPRKKKKKKRREQEQDDFVDDRELQPTQDFKTEIIEEPRRHKKKKHQNEPIYDEPLPEFSFEPPEEDFSSSKKKKKKSKERSEIEDDVSSSEQPVSKKKRLKIEIDDEQIRPDIDTYDHEHVKKKKKKSKHASD